MLNRVSTLVSLLFLAGAVAVSPAQAQKIGYTNQQALLSNMPEMQEVQKKLKQAARQQQQEYRQEQQALQKKLKQYQQQRSLLDDSARAQRERQLRKQQQALQQSSRERQQQLRQRERKLMQPLLEDLQSAINLVADRQGIDMVVRSQSLLFVNQNSEQVVNITTNVANELGISLDQAPSGPSPSVDPSNTPTPTGGGGGGGQK